MILTEQSYPQFGPRGNFSPSSRGISPQNHGFSNKQLANTLAELVKMTAYFTLAAAHRSDFETAILFPAAYGNLISPSVPITGEAASARAISQASPARAAAAA